MGDLAVKEELEAEKEKGQSGASFLDLFRPTKIAVRTLNMCFQWFSATMCYYGLSFASTSLSGDAFTNFLLSVFIEIPSAICCILVIDCWGRRPTLSFCQVVSGLACVVCGLLQGVQDPGLQALQLVLSLGGKDWWDHCPASRPHQSLLAACAGLHHGGHCHSGWLPCYPFSRDAGSKASRRHGG